ncbi:CoA-binding protein [soil metagenome]
MDQAICRAVHSKAWAVVGASNDRAKYGNRIYRDLRAAGYRVYPVNPNESDIEGDSAFARLQDLPESVPVVDIVVPSRIGMTIVEDAIESGAEYFWLQPGAESPDLIERAKAAGLTVIHNRCAMIEKIDWSDQAGGN